MNQAPSSVSIVVMAFNECQSLGEVVQEISAALDKLPTASHEIVIVDDGSSDGTGARADEIAANNKRVRVVHHVVNQGLGGVYRTGFAQARGDFLSFFPADGQFPAEIIERFYSMMPTHDLILGYIPRADAGPVAKGLSLAEKVLYRALFGPMPRYQGVFMLRREVLSRTPLHTQGRGWGVVMELVLKIHRGGYRVSSVLTPFRPRMAGRSKVNNVRSVWANLVQAMAMRSNLKRR